jgi:hypothetical protein
MWQLLSGPLEWLGRLRIGFSRRRPLRVGSPDASDAQGGTGWRAYLAADRLYDVWGPHPDSPWVPFHCVPLFAALDRIKADQVGPTAPPAAGDPMSGRPHARPGAPAPAWLSPGTWVILDLPGSETVEAGAWLITTGGQPVCTFDNWPHEKGLLRAEHLLAALLRWATTVAEARASLTSDAPPVWICDSQRLGSRTGQPGEFDNRYYLDDSLLPGAALLKTVAIVRVVYVTSDVQELPVLDLEEYFADLRRAGLELLHVDLAAGLDATPLAARTTPRQPPRSGFRRSAAGGFGTEVPQPSSGSSG